MADEPFIANEDRPELSLDMDGKVVAVRVHPKGASGPTRH